MFSSFLKIAVRILARQRMYTIINLLGLSIAISCCLLTFMFIRNEFAVNTVFPDVDRIFRIKSVWREGVAGLSMTTLAQAGPTMARAYPEVEAQARMYLISGTVHAGEKNFRNDVMIADPSVISLFDFPLVAGDAKTALEQPRSVVITDRLAYTMFGTVNAIGKIVRFDVWVGGQRDYVVTAVRKTIPSNSVINLGGDQYDLIIPFNTPGDFIRIDVMQSWDARTLVTFVKLAPQTSAQAVQTKLDDFIKTFAPSQYHNDLRLELEPLRDLYLGDAGSLVRRVCLLLAVVAFFILFIACINFATLTSARSFSRAKEIALRKVIGATRRQLVGQFLCESIIISIGATLIAISTTEVSLQSFLQLFGKPLVLEHHWDAPVLLVLAILPLAAGLLSGIYPGMFIASFKPITALRGLLRFKKTTIIFRSGLVVGQFAIAAVLLIAVEVISKQLLFLSEKDLGFPKENLLVISSVPREWNPNGVAKMQVVRDRLLAVSGVKSASVSFDTPTYTVGNFYALRLPSWNAQRAINVPLYTVDDKFAETYGLSLKEGRFFSPEHPSDSSAIVLNETAARLLGLPSGVGSTLIGGHGQPVTVIGVANDFNFESMHTAVRPLVFVSLSNDPIYRNVSLRLSGPDLQDILTRVRQKWAELLPQAPFDFFFLDQRIDQLYRSEHQLRGTMRIAAGIALFIACLGMYGLAALSVTQRTKEIGIRKVLGSSVPSVVRIISMDFIKLVVGANIVAWPLAYYLVSRWLEDFAYRIELGVWTFLFPGLIALITALVTVSYQAVKAAVANPVEALRYE